MDYRIIALTNDRARLIAHQGMTSDRAAADYLAALYLVRGCIVRICKADGELVEELTPENGQ